VLQSIAEVDLSDPTRDYDSDDNDMDDKVFQDEEELTDRLGTIEERVDGDELVLIRVPKDKEDEPFEVLRFDQVLKVLRIFPKSLQLGRLENQFDQVNELQIESPAWDPYNHSAESDQYGLLHARGLPKGFSATYEYGLGIQRDYRGLVRGIEKRTSCTRLRFVISGDEGIDKDGSTFRVALERFGTYCAAVDRSRSRGQTAVRRVMEADWQNAIADLFGLEPVEPKFGRNPVIRALTEEVSTGHVTDPGDRALLVDEITLAAPAIAVEAPERLVQLREDIELVSLQALIERFEKDLNGSFSRDEDHWQDFFYANRFALQMIFSTPAVVKLQQATVRPGGVDGRGARIADFLCVNSVTRTVLIVEIKTPGTSLMSSSAYRGKGTNAAIFPPHTDLSGSIAQVQSQMASVPKDLASRLSPDFDLDAWNDPRGAVIVGKVSALEPLQLESFLRYRAGLSTVTVMGYDEVLERLRALHTMLSSPVVLEEELRGVAGGR
jgi:hypothetical protein